MKSLSLYPRFMWLTLIMDTKKLSTQRFQVLGFNGNPVKNLKSLASIVGSCNDEFMKFDLDYDQIVVLRTNIAKAATVDILETLFTLCDV